MGVARSGVQTKTKAMTTSILSTLLIFTVAAIRHSHCSLQPGTEPLKVYSLGNCTDGWLFRNDLNEFVPSLDSNLYDAITHCSSYQFNAALANTAKHCVDLPETCGQDGLVTGELTAKLSEVAEYVNNFPRSCQDLALRKISTKTGNHIILAPNDTFVEIYCNFDFNFGAPGWMRVMQLDMSDPDAACPDGLFPYYFLGIPYPICDREHYVGGHCDSTFISTHGIPYSSIAGRVRGYQQGGLDGIYPNNGGPFSLEGYYVDGVSITHGSNPRQHVWTFVGGQGEGDALWEDCPCNSGSLESSPSFVGEDYYCESGTFAPTAHTFYPKDPLWDGEGCDFLENTCCGSDRPHLPWFYKQLTTVNVTDSIELRVCSSEGYPDEVTAIDQIEIYVQ